MSPEFYKVLHVFGIFLLFCTLGGLAMIAWQNRGAQATKDEVTGARKRLTMMHGMAMLVVFVSGFGMAGKLGLMAALPVWVYLKIGIWLAFGAALTLVKKVPEHGKIWILVLPVLGATAAYLAVFHPV